MAALPKADRSGQGTPTTGLHIGRTEPQSSTKSLNNRVADTDGGATIATTPEQQQPSEHRQIVVPTHGVATTGAMAAWNNNRLLPGQTPRHNIGETAHTRPKQGKD